MTAKERYEAHGVRFILNEAELNARSKRIKAVLFDWDGVFNDGFKDLDGGSPFSEVDSMGVNLLRFALWKRHAGTMPIAAIITGQHNKYAERFAEREHFHGVYMGFTHKLDAFEDLLAEHDLKAEEVAFFFDDAIDLSVAERCGSRVLIGHRATREFQRVVEHKELADVVVPLGGAHHGLREACELLMSVWGVYDEVIEHRMRYDGTYQRYLAARNEIGTRTVPFAR